MEKKVLRLLYSVGLDIKNKANPSLAGVWMEEYGVQIQPNRYYVKVYFHTLAINLLSMISMERL